MKKGASEIFGPHKPSFYWLFLAKDRVFGIGQALWSCKFGNQCNKGQPPMQMHWIPTMVAPTKKLEPSHKPTDGFAQPRFTPLNTCLYITEDMNQFPILQYRQGANILPSKCEFDFFCGAKFWPVSVFRLSHWLVLQKCLSTSETVSETLVVVNSWLVIQWAGTEKQVGTTPRL